MKKSIFIISFIILSVLFSYSFVYAENPGQQMVNGMKETADGAGNAIEDAANGTAGAIKDGANGLKNMTEDAANNAKKGMENAGENVDNAMENAGNDIQDGAENVGDSMRNAGNRTYEAARTATESPTTNNNNQGWMNRDIWTWIIVGIITIVIVALIWYYASRNTH